MVAVAVAVSSWDVRTSTVVDGTRSIADPAVIELTHAVVHVVTDAIGIGVGSAVAATVSEGVKLVAVAVAVSSGNASAPTVVDGAWSIANLAVIELAYAVVHVVTDAVGIGVSAAVTAAVFEGVVGQTGPVFVCSIRIVVACGFVGAARDFF